MLFLASGLAFNVLLALVPLVLLLISTLSFLLGSEPTEAARTVTALVEGLLPANAPAATMLLRDIVADVLRTRGAIGLYAAVSFAWFSTRLFGSLRSCLVLIFDGIDHGIVVGKVFDVVATLLTTAAIVIYVVFSTYLDLATTRGLAFLVSLGVRESAMGGIGYVGGRILANAVVFMLFYALYRGLPRKRPSWRTAALAAGVAALLFELARHLFALLVQNLDPSSLYTGSIAAIVAVVFWTYYGALLFLVGGEVAHAFDRRRIETSEMVAAAQTTRFPVRKRK